MNDQIPHGEQDHPDSEERAGRRVDAALARENELAERPIPLELPEVAGWKEIPIQENGEPLIPLGPFSDTQTIWTDSVYGSEHTTSPYADLEGALTAVFVREDAAKKLVQAQKTLPQGMHFLVKDGYRPLEVQKALYDQYLMKLSAAHPDWTDEALSAETQRYVSLPSRDPAKPSPHNTGGSVDLTIVRVPDSVQAEIEAIDEELEVTDGSESGNWPRAYELEMRRSSLLRQHAEELNFGTMFDHGGEAAGLNYFEAQAQHRTLEPSEEEARRSRRILYNAMTEVGFEPYADEWWHYNSPLSQMGAKTAGIGHAEYGAMQLSDENQAFEKMRRGHLEGTARMARGESWAPPEGLELHYREAKRAAGKVGDPKQVEKLTPAAKIQPPEAS